jgi:hypothetical protein
MRREESFFNMQTTNNLRKTFRRVYADLGDKQQALTYYNQALPLRRVVGDRGGDIAIDIFSRSRSQLLVAHE